MLIINAIQIYLLIYPSRKNEITIEPQQRKSNIDNLNIVI